MNSTQRKYLIDQIEKSARAQLEALKSAKPEEPKLANYILRVVLSGEFKIRSTESLKEIILQKALKNGGSSENWLAARKNGAYSAFSRNENVVTFETEDFFQIPEDYKIAKKEYDEKIADINVLRHELENRRAGLVTRITLASDKVLQRMINEVDDMGDLSLVDDSLKLLSVGDNGNIKLLGNG